MKIPTLPSQTKMNCFLQTKNEIDVCTKTLRENNLVEHAIDCKNWDLCKIIPHLDHGNIVDLGCIGSHILDNFSKLNFEGLKYGVDILFKPEDIDDSAGSWNNAATPKVAGCKFFKSDLMQTPFEAGLFKYVTCLSVIEHEVDYDKLTSECSRLLSTGGKLFITFDYWETKVNTEATKLYDRDWNILDKNDVMRLVESCEKNGLKITSDIDWTVQDQVINPRYCSPANVSYTLGY